jgi:hypothetical protein
MRAKPATSSRAGKGKPQLTATTNHQLALKHPVQPFVVHRKGIDGIGVADIIFSAEHKVSERAKRAGRKRQCMTRLLALSGHANRRI